MKAPTCRFPAVLKPVLTPGLKPGLKPALKPAVTTAALAISLATTIVSYPTIASASANVSPAVETRVYTTARAAEPPRIDGTIDEPIWNQVEWSGGFTQRDPAEGKPPSCQTAFKILYDDHNLYIAYRAFDPEPKKIANILARRDNFPGDWVEINIDSYHDHRSGFSFTASVSGTQGDEFISEDGNNWDSNWDPVWEHKARIDEAGWTTEVRIPLSQLRYPNTEEQVWGIQVQRRIHRFEERSTWQVIPKDGSGWVSKFGELRGIKGIKPQRQVELTPYGVVQGERFQKVPGNPFATGSKEKVSGGLDGKIGVSGNLTLDLTVNPDFGQIEADPSQVNLTAFETFFEEKRPFFIEGNNIFEFRVAPSIAYGTHTRDRLFYSRRIGRSPHYRADQNEPGFVDQPEKTAILGASKLTGKTAGGLSIGVLESVAAKEFARVELNGQRREVAVEPMTNYFVSRLQRDFRRGETRIGGLLTAVNRKIDDRELEDLHQAAYTGGIDFFHYLARRRFYVAVNVLGSQVRGSRQAILTTQTSPARYFQRPDNRGQSVDSTRTSLSGHGGSVRLGKGTGSFNFETGTAWRSPGLELNDLGYMRNADEINQFSWVGYNFRNPFACFREMGLNFNQWFDFKYGGENIYQAANFNTNASFRNNWSYYASISRQNERISNYELRGGPSIKIPGDVNLEASINSDERRSLSFSVGGVANRTDADAGRSNWYWILVGWRPTNAIRIQLNPSYGIDRPDMQYVSHRSMGGQDRYIYGSMEQKTLDSSFRVDYSLTPRLTVQYYGAPFISAGHYARFRRVVAPRAAAYADRFQAFGDGARRDEVDHQIHVDENGDGFEDYSFGDPDFNVRNFNSNLVLRWQYSPGSSLYLVWSQARSGFVPNGRFAIRDDMDGLFGIHPDNVFLLKVNRWFDL